MLGESRNGKRIYLAEITLDTILFNIVTVAKRCNLHDVASVWGEEIVTSFDVLWPSFM